MHSVQTRYHRATNRSRCPQWPGHLSTVACAISGGCAGEFQSNSTPRFRIPLAAKESFAPRKNFTIRDGCQASYQHKCGSAPKPPSITERPRPHSRHPRPALEPRFSAWFPPFSEPREGHYSIRVKHPQGPLDNGRSHARHERPMATVARAQRPSSPVWTSSRRLISAFARSCARACAACSHCPNWKSPRPTSLRAETSAPAATSVVQTSAKWRSVFRPHRSHRRSHPPKTARPRHSQAGPSLAWLRSSLSLPSASHPIRPFPVSDLPGASRAPRSATQPTLPATPNSHTHLHPRIFSVDQC